MTISAFSPNTERRPATLRISTDAYRDLDFSDRKLNDDVTFVVKGRVTGLDEDFENKEEIVLEVEAITIEDATRRAGLDETGRVK